MRLVCVVCLCWAVMLGMAQNAGAATLHEIKMKMYANDSGKVSDADFFAYCNAVLRDPENGKDVKAYCYVVQAFYFVDRKDFPRAYAELQKALETDDSFYEVYNGFGYYYVRQKKYGEAATSYEQAAELAAMKEKKIALLRSANKYYALAHLFPVETFYRESAKNWYAARETYSQKPVALRGRVADISASPDGKPVLTFVMDKGAQVICELGNADKREAMDLSVGDEATVICRFARVEGANLIMGGELFTEPPEPHAQGSR